jgi:hypothetical protein
MAWYDEAAEIYNAAEREQFIKGAFGFHKKDNSSLIAGLIGGFIGAQIATMGTKRND